ncbi:tyrosine-type recombinase/integrase [Aliiroseovarius sp.]|uniref:tyrosine-type recombinase/integrase n=1 Tax=Aliiroseovarius sp. TaxID=1872442 RepID=UPI003BACE38E
MTYDQALSAATDWFKQAQIVALAAQPYAVGINSKLKYTKTNSRFTVGDAMYGFVEWKRIAAAPTYFETTLSLINCHIIPRLGDRPVEELTQQVFTEFCLDILETAPKRGNQTQGAKTRLHDLDHEALRKRKKTLNTVIGILRTAIEMAWENGDVESERSWRRLHRVPHADAPRQFFLTRAQAKRLIASCRPDLALLVQAALYTGCRVSELARMKARDVGGNVYGVYVAPMKSYRGRYVILPDEGMTFFLDQIEKLEDEQLVFRTASERSWAGLHKHLFKEAVRRAGLPEEFVFHGLRHTYASQLVQAGTPLAIVAKQLGHSNTDTVSRTYGHLCCDSIEFELSKRFAPLQQTRKDGRLKRLKASLQNRSEPNWSWPLKNRSKSNGVLVELLRGREAELRGQDT